MAQIDLIMPKMGESIMEATIIRWLKSEGEKVEADEAILEIATDKVDSEVPSPASGTLVKKMFKDGDVVKIGTVIAVLSTEAGAAVSPAPAPEAPPAGMPKPANGIVSSPSPPASATVNAPLVSGSGRFYSPLVKSIARNEGISIAELDAIPGSGNQGRVTKKDILTYLPSRKGDQPARPAAPSQPATSPAQSPAPQPAAAASVSGQGEIIEMDRMRKLIADHMVMSKHTSPHVTSFVEADVTNIVTWRERIRSGFEKREKEKITYTPVFAEAVIRAIKDFPLINVSVDGTRIIVKKDIHIGIAAALPSGNLIVPVIKRADHLNLLGLAKAVNDLAARARANKLSPDDIQGGTFTISNVGTFGNLMGTPIINQPQVAILATGSIKKKPVVIESPQGDTIGIRHMMFLSLSYDHRVVDGMLGGSFLRRIADYLEAFDPSRSI